VKILKEYIYWTIDFDNKKINSKIKYHMIAITDVYNILLDIWGFAPTKVTAIYNSKTE